MTSIDINQVFITNKNELKKYPKNLLIFGVFRIKA